MFLGFLARLAARYFAAWVCLAGLLGFLWPDFFRVVIPHIPAILGVIMFGMGLTLDTDDLKAVAKRPWYVAAGCAAQYTIMPLAGFLFAVLFRVPPEIAVGIVLVGSCPGGTASNVITFMARGDVALSVAMTTASTLLAPVATPLLTWWLAGMWVPVDAAAMFTSVFKVIIVPVAAGVLARRFLGQAVKRSTQVLPLISMAGIMLIVAAVIGINAARILSSGATVVAAVILHNVTGLALGYMGAVVLHMREPARRALSIEVGMQNSGLAASLALAHFNPGAALPAALFSVWHNLSGSLLATFWSRRGGAGAPSS